MKNKDINNIATKVLSKNKYLTENDAAILFSQTSKDSIDIIRGAADELRQAINGDKVTYTVNLNVNFTNICSCNCLFCGFKKSLNDKDAYVLDLEDLYIKLATLVKNGGMEVCYQGGLYPELKIPGLQSSNILELYGKLLLWTKEHFPTILTHAYSPEEIDFLSILTGKSHGYVLEYLKDSGLDTMPGTAAEILNDDIRKLICPKKLNTRQWIKIIKTAHKLDIKSTCTIMYGHYESSQHLAEHLNILREIQIETKGFTEFIPLPFIANKTLLSGKVKPLTSVDRLKMLAISRLFFADIIPNIQASWVKQGMEETKESLHWGVNDIGGTLGDEKITYAAGGEFGRSLEACDLINLIESSGKTPALRDTLYNIIPAKVQLTCK